MPYSISHRHSASSGGHDEKLPPMLSHLILVSSHSRHHQVLRGRPGSNSSLTARVSANHRIDNRDICKGTHNCDTSIDSNRSTESLQFVATPTSLLFVVVQYLQISTGAVVVDSHISSYPPWGRYGLGSPLVPYGFGE